jgi:hypothetical protein
MRPGILDVAVPQLFRSGGFNPLGLCPFDQEYSGITGRAPFSGFLHPKPIMSASTSLYQEIEQDIWKWINEFVTVPNEFYNFKFPPCPFARQAVMAKTVDVKAWRSGDVRAFIRAGAMGMRDNPDLTTRVLAFPPRVELQTGINAFVDSFNEKMIPDNVFMNTGVARTTSSRYPGPDFKKPYFIVVANSLAPVLDGCETLKRTQYYKDWPKEHYGIVVERRARMAEQFGRKEEQKDEKPAENPAEAAAK